MIAVGLTGSWLFLVVLVAADLRDAAYYSTASRFGEILAGCLLGCVAPPATLARRVPGLSRLGGPALAGLAVAVVTVDAGGRWTYLVLPIVAGLSVAVIAGALRSGALATALSWRPLVLLGMVSYGVYVFHWPVFLYLTAARTGLGPHALHRCTAAHDDGPGQRLLRPHRAAGPAVGAPSAPAPGAARPPGSSPAGSRWRRS